MADRPGHLLYHGRSSKLMGGIDDLSPRLRSYIAQNFAKYLKAPNKFEQPNETSWTYFKQVLDAKRADRLP